MAAVAEKDHVIPRTLISTSIAASGLLAQPPIKGIVIDVSGDAATVLWDIGRKSPSLDVTDTTVSPLLRIAQASAGAIAALTGKKVALTGASPEFAGPVLEVLAIELSPADDPNTFTDCVVVQSSGTSQAFFVADASAVSVVG